MVKRSLLFIAFVLFSWPGLSLSQQYRLEIGDRLRIAFWQEPGMNSEVKIGQDGRIELPVIGRIRASGLTTSELADNIVEQVSRYRINITQASITVTEYQGNKVYLTGQVGSPGTYSFEVMPNLWRVIQEAGGLLETADPTRISIIGTGEGKGNITEVDLTRYFEGGDPNLLPGVTGGETIHVPSRPVGGAGQNGGSSPFSARNEIYIMGAVAAPGRYNLEEDIDVLDALVLAGGPTDNAKLSDVRIMKRWDGKRAMMKIDINNYLEHSEPGPPPLSAGDTIFVPEKAGAGKFVVNSLLLPILTSATVLLVVQLIQ